MSTENKIGRPERNCKWPTGRNFGLKEVSTRMKNLGHDFTVAGLRAKAKRDIEKGILEQVENKDSGKRGRPAALYRVVE